MQKEKEEIKSGCIRYHTLFCNHMHMCANQSCKSDTLSTSLILFQGRIANVHLFCPAPPPPPPSFWHFFFETICVPDGTLENSRSRRKRFRRGFRQFHFAYFAHRVIISPRTVELYAIRKSYHTFSLTSLLWFQASHQSKLGFCQCFKLTSN